MPISDEKIEELTINPNPEITKLISQLFKELSETKETIREALLSMQPIIPILLDALKVFLDPEFIENFKKWPVVAAARYGWFMNWFTSLDAGTALLKGGKDGLDSFMVSHLERDWNEITERIISLCPERKHILNVAFNLHKEGNYIACIPLFLSQTDGICAQYLGAFLFSEHERRKAVIEDAIGEAGDNFVEVLLHVLNVKTQFMAGISQASSVKKQIGPNRNGVMHGSVKHLDYGSRINSMKCFSLLAFTAFCLANRPPRRRRMTRHHNLAPKKQKKASQSGAD